MRVSTAVSCLAFRDQVRMHSSFTNSLDRESLEADTWFAQLRTKFKELFSLNVLSGGKALDKLKKRYNVTNKVVFRKHKQELSEANSYAQVVQFALKYFLNLKKCVQAWEKTPGKKLPKDLESCRTLTVENLFKLQTSTEKSENVYRNQCKTCGIVEKKEQERLKKELSTLLSRISKTREHVLLDRCNSQDDVIEVANLICEELNRNKPALTKKQAQQQQADVRRRLRKAKVALQKAGVGGPATFNPHPTPAISPEIKVKLRACSSIREVDALAAEHGLDKMKQRKAWHFQKRNGKLSVPHDTFGTRWTDHEINTLTTFTKWDDILTHECFTNRTFTAICRKVRELIKQRRCSQELIQTKRFWTEKKTALVMAFSSPTEAVEECKKAFGGGHEKQVRNYFRNHSKKRLGRGNYYYEKALWSPEEEAILKQCTTEQEASKVQLSGRSTMACKSKWRRLRDAGQLGVTEGPLPPPKRVAWSTDEEEKIKPFTDDISLRIEWAKEDSELKTFFTGTGRSLTSVLCRFVQLKKA